jgi:hypothetical protein
MKYQKLLEKFLGIVNGIFYGCVKSQIKILCILAYIKMKKMEI